LTPTVEVRSIRKAYEGHVAVDDLSMEVPAGTVFGLLGQNGAGKTTTIRMIMDILAPDRGEIHLFGRQRQPGDGRRIGYLPEERGLYRKMTVVEQLVFLAELHGVARGEAARRAREWLARIELAQWGDKKVETLSKGMQQKIQLVATVLHAPELLVLDEPFSGLDPINQGLFKDLIAEFRDKGCTILFSTHILEQAEKLCDRVAMIAEGRVVLSGELAKLKRERGSRVVRIGFAGPPPPLAGLPGVATAVLENSHATVELAPAADPADLLAALAASGARIRAFQPVEPDLESIFVEAVRHAR